MSGYLCDDVRCHAEAVDAQASRVARFHGGPVTNQPGAKQRRGFRIGVRIRKAKTEARIGDGRKGTPCARGASSRPSRARGRSGNAEETGLGGGPSESLGRVA
jgi:hypothetical protein